VETLGNGMPRLRILNGDPCFLAPCRDPDRSCPKGTPEKPNTLSPENELCYAHYKQCRSVGIFPDDPVVRRNAAVIHETEESVERARKIEFQSTLLKLVGGLM